MTMSVSMPNTNQEKQARSDLKAETQRLVSKTDVLILDALNYIKVTTITSKEISTFCVIYYFKARRIFYKIYCNTSVDLARQWNNQRQLENSSEAYAEPIFDALTQRFEPPDGKNRWDSPLFEITPEMNLPCEQIIDFLLNKRPPPPNKSTVNLPISDTNFLYDVDKLTQDAIDSIVQQSKMAVIGQEFSVPLTNEKIIWNHSHSASDLRRIRQQYLKFIKTHPPSKETATNITTMFVQFLNNNL
ncbi:unnamed protein product [Didymodactylos carnosus]|uniref:Protein KTI12 homolog n=1 Tax=Didymodactylos carnosus TaxID=1234261 RepID=A0A813NKP9_9BILA|nr:unnamed protein product [Didymodactylos carnosus]CAF0754048.1 unnamed protein product [Didymodactylos carnosus]CAF3519362.1 unnamed protein product [Didymodactylos carnosus]CAF3533079.1 unnamed protein product [Didymodactylos carnosus]